jgi:pyruvate dehydrogenase E2 component (dihydrolipoamide acetyltransferase)
VSGTPIEALVVATAKDRPTVAFADSQIDGPCFRGDKNSWQFEQEPVSAGRTVYAVDLPGHGTSDKDVSDASLDRLARAVLGFLDEVDAARAHLVGHSLGGAVVVAAAALAPERIRSLTLVAPAGFGSRPDVEYLRDFSQAHGLQHQGRRATAR